MSDRFELSELQDPQDRADLARLQAIVARGDVEALRHWRPERGTVHPTQEVGVAVRALLDRSGVAASTAPCVAGLMARVVALAATPAVARHQAGLLEWSVETLFDGRPLPEGTVQQLARSAHWSVRYRAIEHHAQTPGDLAAHWAAEMYPGIQQAMLRHPRFPLGDTSQLLQRLLRHTTRRGTGPVAEARLRVGTPEHPLGRTASVNMVAIALLCRPEATRAERERLLRALDASTLERALVRTSVQRDSLAVALDLALDPSRPSAWDVRLRVRVLWRTLTGAPDLERWSEGLEALSALDPYEAGQALKHLAEERQLPPLSMAERRALAPRLLTGTSREIRLAVLGWLGIPDPGPAMAPAMGRGNGAETTGPRAVVLPAGRTATGTPRTGGRAP